jgi:hypothetical protein
LQVPSFAAFDAPAVPENPDVLGHRRLTAPELLIKLVQVFVTFIQQLQNADPRRVGDRFEPLGNFPEFVCSQIFHVNLQFRWLNPHQHIK